MKPRYVVLVFALLAVLTLAGAAGAAVVQEGNLRVSIATRLEPYKLPRLSSAPIKAFIAGHVFTADGQTPPQLKRMDIEINRHGQIETEGLPVCGLSEIKATSTEAALARCGEALVGSGHFWASVVFNDEALPYHTTGRLLAFNGLSGCVASSSTQSLVDPDRPAPFSQSPSSGRLRPSRSRTQGGRQGERTSVRDPQTADRGRRDATCHRRPELLIHIYTTQPFPSAFVVVFTIKQVHDGPYGTELSASLPQALGDWGFVNRIKMNIGRDYTYEGRRRGYLEASCPAPKGAGTASFPLALANFAFEETQLSSTVTKSCGVKE